MALVRCPICDRQFVAEGSPAMPFCCDRCRLVDLNRWLGEEYGLPYEPPEADTPEYPDPEQ
ncbi:MAG: DNA gyrase inhibitor YacG [Planctomycetota bacterium]